MKECQGKKRGCELDRVHSAPLRDTTSAIDLEKSSILPAASSWCCFCSNYYFHRWPLLIVYKMTRMLLRSCLKGKKIKRNWKGVNSNKLFLPSQGPSLKTFEYGWQGNVLWDLTTTGPPYFTRLIYYLLELDEIASSCCQIWVVYFQINHVIQDNQRSACW